LLQEGANVRAFDPIATEEAARALGDAAASIVFETRRPTRLRREQTPW
jgi:hypothetical protein